MIKKILFTFFLCIAFSALSQQKSIDKIVATPNPFKVSTKITFKSSSQNPVIFTVKNVLGKTVYNKQLKVVRGQNTISFSKGDLSTGIYIYTLQNKKQIISKRLVIQ